MTSFTVSDEWKNEEEWVNRSKRELLEIVEGFAMRYQVALMKSKEKDKEIDELENVIADMFTKSSEEINNAKEELKEKDKEIARLRAEIADHELNRRTSKSFPLKPKDLPKDSNHDR